VLPVVSATRYVTPLREGWARFPGLVEADDLGTYVVKFAGAGQGPLVLVAEIVVGELARRLGLPVPTIKLLELDARIGRYEPDEEVQDLLTASVGLNLAVDFLPGSLESSAAAAAAPVDAALAARILWLDACVANVDRSWRNPNLLVWHGDLWCIDHGASLRFQHGWAAGRFRPSESAAAFAAQPYDAAITSWLRTSARLRRRWPPPTARWLRRSPRRCCGRSSTWFPTSGWPRRLAWTAPPRCATPTSSTCSPEWARARPTGRRGCPGPKVPPRERRLRVRAAHGGAPIDRGERINVGVLLHCQQADFLAAAVSVDADRLRALDPAVDVTAVCAALDTIQRICTGVGADAGGDRRAGHGLATGPATGPPRGRRPRAERQHGRAVRSAGGAAIDCRPARPRARRPHDDPAAALERLLDRLVRIAG
jgi:hypothetical protein